MKMRISEKELKKSFKNIYCVGYCELKMLEVLEADYYTTGVYGWNCDVYKVNGYILTTGYRPFGTSIDKKYINKCNKEFEVIYNKYKYDKNYKYKQYIEECNYILKNFINDVVLDRGV